MDPRSTSAALAAIKTALAETPGSRSSRFHLPAPDKRITFIGRNGSGKTTAAADVLSFLNFEARPWVIIDTKNEILFREAGPAVMQPMPVAGMPGKNGLWHCVVNPWDLDPLEGLLRRIHLHGNIGVFVDEAMNLPPRSPGWSAIQRQGRSKLIPTISCTQRPRGCGIEIFSEADYLVLFRLQHPDDRKIVAGFLPNGNYPRQLPRRFSWWYDVAADWLEPLRPFESPDIILARLRDRAPRRSWWKV